MVTKDRKLIVFSIITSAISALLGFVQKFIDSLDKIDYRVIFIAGILIFLVVIILLFFLARELIGKVRERNLAKRMRKRKR